jgi:N-methylhydantoinase A
MGLLVLGLRVPDFFDDEECWSVSDVTRPSARDWAGRFDAVMRHATAQATRSSRGTESSGVQIGIDIGGTFTDVVASKDGRMIFTAKVPSTPVNLALGVRQAVRRVLESAGGDAADIERFVHGTTVATNAVLERKGVPISILTTAGFEDVLEIGRLKRSRMYDLFIDAETPVFIAPRRRRYGIHERVDARGRVIVALDEAHVRMAVEDAMRRHHIRAVAVCYLFAFLNPIHELRTREIIRAMAPELSVSLSSDVSPVFREYERTVLTAFDAYIRPIIVSYLTGLQAELSAMGIDGTIQVMQSRGGISAIENMIARPVTSLLSGPAGGVLGGKFESKRSGFSDVITLDMGGTSCDVALVRGGHVPVTTESTIGTYPLQMPMVDVNTIGAGGSTVAWLDSLGGLRVGPQSVGSEPGPACYGNGGSQATVTDASVVLGYLNPEYFAAGALRLDVAAAEAAIAELARGLRLGLLETALGIHRVVNARMADQIGLVSLKRGHDPRRFALVLFGGAGPVHGGLLARQLGVPVALVPGQPGVLSAFGLLVARIEHDQARTFVVPAHDVDVQRMHGIFADLEEVGREKMARETVPLDAIRVMRSVDMRYVGQSYELEVPLIRDVGPDIVSALVADFHRIHEEAYGHASPDSPVELVNLRVVQLYSLPAPSIATGASRGGDNRIALKATRRAVFQEHPHGTDVDIYERSLLALGTLIEGPAIIEQPDTTTVVYPSQVCMVDKAGNMLIRPACPAPGLRSRGAAEV